MTATVRHRTVRSILSTRLPDLLTAEDIAIDHPTHAALLEYLTEEIVGGIEPVDEADDQERLDALADETHAILNDLRVDVDVDTARRLADEMAALVWHPQPQPQQDALFA